MINYVQKKPIREERVSELLKKSTSLNQFSNDGPIKKELEKLLHSKLNLSNKKAVVCLSNGTTACHALMYMFEKKKGKKLKWAVPAFTFPTPVVAGFNSKIVDIDDKTYTIALNDPNIKNVDGIIITNLFGTCNAIEEWEDFCKKENKILIFDNASSPFTTLHEKNICDYGDSSFGSLHHTKYLGFGEGGFVVVPAEDYLLLNSVANFGFTSQRIHHHLSSNYKMSEVSAAYCYAQIENYDIKNHLKIQDFLIKNLEKEDIKLFNSDNKACFYVLGNLPIIFDQDIEISEFRNLGVEANKYYKPLKKLKNSNHLFNRIINLPLHNGLLDYQLDLMIQVCCEIKKGKHKK